MMIFMIFTNTSGMIFMKITNTIPTVFVKIMNIIPHVFHDNPNSHTFRKLYFTCGRHDTHRSSVPPTRLFVAHDIEQRNEKIA